MKELARDLLDAVIGGNVSSALGSAPVLGQPTEAPRPLAATIDPLSFASSRVLGSSLGGDEGRLRLPPIEQRRRRRVRGTVSTNVAISPLAGSEAPGTRVVRRRA